MGGEGLSKPLERHRQRRGAGTACRAVGAAELGVAEESSARPGMARNGAGTPGRGWSWKNV